MLPDASLGTDATGSSISSVIARTLRALVARLAGEPHTVWMRNALLRAARRAASR